MENMGFVWISESAKTLGIIFSNDKKSTLDNNV